MGGFPVLRSKKSTWRPRRYWAISALAALALGVGMVFMLGQPAWKTSFTYQYVPQAKPILGLEHTVPAMASSDLTGGVVAQMAIIKSPQVLTRVQAALKQQQLGIKLPEQIAQAITLTHPPESSLIQVTVETPSKPLAQGIAIQLNQAYLQYLQTLQQDIARKELELVENRLVHAKKQLQKEEASLEGFLKSQPLLQGAPLVSDAGFWENLLIQNYGTLTQRIKTVDAEIAEADATYRHYAALLNQDEKTLIEGVVVGSDPLLQKLSEKIASAEGDPAIVSVNYTPPAHVEADLKKLQARYETERQRVLSQQSAKGKPIIRDDLRKQFIEAMVQSKAKLQSAKAARQVLEEQQQDLLSHINQQGTGMDPVNAWMLQKKLLQNTIAALQQRRDELAFQVERPVLPVRLFQPIPDQPQPVRGMPNLLGMFLLAFGGAFAGLVGWRKVQSKPTETIARRSLLQIVTDLLQTQEQKILLMLPVTSSGHLSASPHLGGLLNQFGRDAVILDIDLSHRMLSRKLYGEHPHGIFEHLLYPEMKKPYLEPLSGAKIIPLETTLEAERIVEFSQVIQRLPRIWSRWSSSVIILDVGHWHEAYHQLLSQVSQVIFYIPPNHPQANQVLLPKLFQGKYQVPVSVVEIQPEL